MTKKIQINKYASYDKRIGSTRDIINKNPQLLLLSKLNMYTRSHASEKFNNLYTELPSEVKELGYKSLGDLLLKNIKIDVLQENDALYIVKLFLYFDLNAVSKETADQIIELFNKFETVLDEPERKKYTKREPS